MKVTLCLISLFSAFVHAKNGPDFEALDNERKAAHAQAETEIRDLNDLRNKILGVSQTAENLAKTWKDQAKKCTSKVTGVELQTCHAIVASLANSATLELDQLELLMESQSFKSFISRPSPNAVNFQGLVRETTSTLINFSKNASELRRRMGQKIAAEEFQTTMATIKADNEKTKLEMQCRLMPATLSNKLISAQLVQQNARQKSNPHLLLKSQLIANEVSQTAELLAAKCPRELEARMRSYQNQATSIAGQVTPAEINALATEACKKIGNSDKELANACQTADFSPPIIYSIHRKLESQGRKK